MNAFDFRTTAGVERLLGRSPHPPSSAEANNLIRGRRILITGAGGSIGGELVRQIATMDPSAIFLLDHDESHMHAIQLELFGDGQLDHERTVLADIRDPELLKRLFRELRPEIVFHAAAHKHLSILERYPSEAVRTNTLGTQNVIEACVAAETERLIFVSTDKAADPTSVLGATKHLAELLVRAAASDRMLTASVRFGNVLGSRGSFLHTLAHQMRTGAAVTLTHPEVERYFMSIPEAASLVVEASVMAGEGEIYVLDMGEPVRIADLVRRFARATEAASPDIRIVGLRKGEKLSEDLTSSTEKWCRTERSKIWKVEANRDCGADLQAFSALFHSAELHDEEAVRHELSRVGLDLGAPTRPTTTPTTPPLVPLQRGAGLEVAS